MVQGVSLWVGFLVYGPFMEHGSGVYDACSGEKKGAHAVVLLGYGLEGGTKYWHMQNSWGTKWGTQGYTKFKRGSNACMIEEFLPGAFIGHVNGGHKDPCYESGNAAWLGPDPEKYDKIYQCAEIGQYCDHAQHGIWLKNTCPITCKKQGCGDRDGEKRAPGQPQLSTTTTTTTRRGGGGNIC